MSIEQKYRFKKHQPKPTKKVVFQQQSEREQSGREKFPLIGISSSLKEYTLCYFLSKVLRISFERKPDITTIHPRDGSSQKFSVYHAVPSLNNREYLLFANKFRQTLLAEEYPEMEFLLRMNGETDNGYILQTMQQIRSIDGVIMAAELDSRLLHAPSLLHWEMPVVRTTPSYYRKKKITL